VPPAAPSSRVRHGAGKASVTARHNAITSAPLQLESTISEALGVAPYHSARSRCAAISQPTT
jgi:hypothetical protein